MIVDELIAILGYDVKGQENLDRFNRGMEQAEQKAQAVANRINAIQVAIGTFVGQVAVDLARSLGRTIGSLPGDIIGVGSVFEKLETTLTTIEGSSDKAKAALDWVADFAATTPYELNEVAEAFVRMRAYGLDPMSGQLEGVGNAASAMGKGLMQGVEAIADAVTGENERLKEFGIRASAEKDRITYTWQQAGETMTKTVKKDGTEIANALMEIFSRFDGAMDAQSKTWEGMTSNFGDQWTAFLKSISDAGYYEDVKRRFRGMVDVIDQWREQGYLDSAAQAVSNFLTGSMYFAERVGKALLDIGKAAYSTAAGITDLVSRVTGLNTAASAGVLGAAVIGSTAMGRGLMVALAKRIPALAAFLLVEDIMGGIRGDDSYIGSLEGGQEALDKVRKSASDLSEAVREVTSAFEGLFAFDFAGFSWGGFFSDELVRFVRELAQTISQLSNAMDALREGDLGKLWRSVMHGETREDAQNQKIKAQEDASAATVEGNTFIGMLAGMERMQANMAKQDGSAVANATLNDNKQDNRDQSTHVSVGGVQVNVQSPASAPAAVGEAVGNAVGQAAARQPSRFEMGPAF